MTKARLEIKMAPNMFDPSLACQPLHPRKEGLVSLEPNFRVEWVELTHKHTLDNTLLTSDIRIAQKWTLSGGGLLLKDV